MRIACLFFLWFSLVITAFPQIASKPRHDKKFQYEEVDFEDMLRRYLSKEAKDDLEGIYDVSCVITSRKKKFLSKRERIKIEERKDNYARIAIIKDWPGSDRDFIEISMSYHDAKKFPIVGEINSLSEGHGYMYKHMDADGKIYTFSMMNESFELLEAEFSYMDRATTVTYKLSYLKSYPKGPDIVKKWPSGPSPGNSYRER